MADQAALDRSTLAQHRRERRGAWVYLEQSDAAAHPDYGVFGWALLLLGALFVGPLILLWQDVQIAFGPYARPDNVWIILAVDVVLLIAAWTSCRLLGAERPQFYTWFFITIILTLCSLAAFVSLCLYDVREILPFGALVEGDRQGWTALFADVPSIVWWGIAFRFLAVLLASAYVMQSRRLNVTLSKRVSPSDPYVHQAWVSATRAPTYAELEPTTVEDRPVARQAPARQEAVRREEPVVDAHPAATSRTTAPNAHTVERTTHSVTRTAEERAPMPSAAPQAAETTSTTTTTTTTTTTSTAAAPPMDDRRMRARLKQLDDARAAGLISDAEYDARRQSLLR